MRILRIIPGRAPTAFFGGTPTACLASWRRWRRQYPSRKESAGSARSAESVVHFLTCVAYPGPFGRYATVPRLLTGSSQVEAQSYGWQLEAQRSRCMAHVSRRNPASYVRIHTETGDARSSLSSRGFGDEAGNLVRHSVPVVLRGEASLRAGARELSRA